MNKDMKAALEALAKFARALQEGRSERFEACGVEICSIPDALVAADVEKMARAGLGETL